VQRRGVGSYPPGAVRAGSAAAQSVRAGQSTGVGARSVGRGGTYTLVEDGSTCASSIREPMAHRPRNEPGGRGSTYCTEGRLEN
jgi:hypothetical protein